MSTLDELTRPLTVDEVKRAIYATLAASGVDTTSWKSGAVVRTIIAGVSVVLSAASTLQAAIAKSGFLDLASGDWLTVVAKYVYDVDRNQGSFATSTVTVSNAAGGVYSGDAGDLVFASSATGKTYRNTAAFSIVAGPSSATIAVQADELGTASNAPANGIDTFVTPLNGVTITSSTTASGDDVEDDAALRLRCREKTAVLSPNGPRDAYAYIARSAKRDGVSIGVTRVKTVADGIGGVDVYCADADGTITGTVGDTSTDLGVIDDDIQRLVAPLAITARTHGATPHTISLQYELWVRDTLSRTTSQLQSDIEARYIAHLAAVPIGGELITGESTGRVYRSAIEGVIGAEVGNDLVKLTIAAPGADVDIASTEAPIAGSVAAIAVHLVAGGSL